MLLTLHGAVFFVSITGTLFFCLLSSETFMHAIPFHQSGHDRIDFDRPGERTADGLTRTSEDYGDPDERRFAHAEFEYLPCRERRADPAGHV